MRFSKINLLALALLVVGAGSASAFVSGAPANTTVTSAYAGGALSPSDSVTVDLYLDADPGLVFFAVAVLWNDDTTLAYVPSNSMMPTYILYNYVSKGVASQLIPNVNPPGYWNGINVPGKRQFNVEYVDLDFGGNGGAAGGIGVWIASVAFHVENTTQATNTITVTYSANGTIVEDAAAADLKGLSTITNPDLVLNLPEPSAALLGVGAVASLVFVRSRRRR